MKRLVASRGTHVGFNPRQQFRAAWVAAFLGLALIIGVVFWAVFAYR